MGLALAVAGVSDNFLGHSVVEHGRVLYFDEENPPDLVYSRFRKLGLKIADGQRIRYINNANARLDRSPDLFLEEAMDFEPSLIVLDSLTRFHGGDENNSGEMARLFSDGIKPLARETDAAVVLIHHANKTDSSSGYKRARGSGDITASVDAAFDVRQVDLNLLEIHNFKSRRQAQGEVVYYSIVDTEGGRVELKNVSAPDVF
jgi:RecA-family ATPase